MSSQTRRRALNNKLTQNGTLTSTPPRKIRSQGALNTESCPVCNIPIFCCFVNIYQPLARWVWKFWQQKAWSNWSQSWTTMDNNGQQWMKITAVLHASLMPVAVKTLGFCHLAIESLGLAANISNSCENIGTCKPTQTGLKNPNNPLVPKWT